MAPHHGSGLISRSLVEARRHAEDCAVPQARASASAGLLLEHDPTARVAEQARVAVQASPIGDEGRPLAVTVVRNVPIVDAELNALRAAAWSQVGDQVWSPILRRSLGWVGATDGDRLVGFVNVAWDGGVHAFLLDTTVHPDYQRRGLGRSLVREAAAMARELGAEWLHVDHEDELDSFYRGCGFRPTRAGLIDLTASAPSGRERSAP